METRVMVNGIKLNYIFYIIFTKVELHIKTPR